MNTKIVQLVLLLAVSSLMAVSASSSRRELAAVDVNTIDCAANQPWWVRQCCTNTGVKKGLNNLVKKCASCTNDVGAAKAWACHQCFDRNIVGSAYVLRRDCASCVSSLVSTGTGREWACAGVCAKKDLYGTVGDAKACGKCYRLAPAGGEGECGNCMANSADLAKRLAVQNDDAAVSTVRKSCLACAQKGALAWACNQCVTLSTTKKAAACMKCVTSLAKGATSSAAAACVQSNRA